MTSESHQVVQGQVRPPRAAWAVGPPPGASACVPLSEPETTPLLKAHKRKGCLPGVRIFFHLSQSLMMPGVCVCVCVCVCVLGTFEKQS